MFKRNYGQRVYPGKSTFYRGKSLGKRRGGSRNFSQTIDVARFVRKAEPQTLSKPYEPINQFIDFPIDERLKKNIREKGYVLPTPIQDKAIKPILDRMDVVGVANTGTGKTAAFLIPLLHKVLTNQKEKILIIVPTRELALQINDELVKFRGPLNVFSACCFGGSSLGQQISFLRRQHNFVIGTPGRLKDLIERKHLNLSTFATLVLDEADRMLDMGFVKDMRFIMSGMADNRQTLLFSATVSKEIDGLIKEFLREPTVISVKTGETSRNIDQDIVRIAKGEEKIDILHDLLKQPHFSKVLIFGRTKFGVERLSEMLSKRGIKVETIHGNKNQSGRRRALDNFKGNFSRILVATDVAARGLDIPNVSHVINYDLPATYDDYIHRIGRTGRGNELGQALTFVE